MRATIGMNIMKNMDTVKAVLGVIFRYPVKKLIKDIDNLQEHRKTSKSYFRILFTSLSGLAGGFLPSVLPEVAHYLQGIFDSIFVTQLPGGVSVTTATVACVLVSAAIGSKISKMAFQQYMAYLHHGDTNSDHILTVNELYKLSTFELSDKKLEDTPENRAEVATDIQNDFNYIVNTLRRSKPAQKIWAKTMLKQYRQGDPRLYEEFYKSMHKVASRLDIDECLLKLAQMEVSGEVIQEEVDVEEQKASDKIVNIDISQTPPEDIEAFRKRMKQVARLLGVKPSVPETDSKASPLLQISKSPIDPKVLSYLAAEHHQNKIACKKLPARTGMTA